MGPDCVGKNIDWSWTGTKTIKDDDIDSFEGLAKKEKTRIENREKQLATSVPPVLGKPTRAKQMKRKETFRRKR